jgi:hypothetical protein
VAEYADHHEYLEDIFQLPALLPPDHKPVKLETVFDLAAITTVDIDRAREVSGYFTTHRSGKERSN